MSEALQSGKAAEIFGRMVSALGGPADFMENYQNHLANAPVIVPVHAEQEGAVIATNARQIGLGVVALGGGRTRPQDEIDHRVGYSDLAAIGDHVDRDTPLAMIHAASEGDANAAAAMIRKAYTIGKAREVPENPTIIERVAL